MTDHQPTIAVDFDGVIHAHTSPWTGPLDIHDPPVPGAIEWLRALLADGWRVWLHTCRLTHSIPAHLTPFEEIDMDPRMAAICAWFVEHDAADVLLDVELWTHGGKPHADVYVDDRGWRFEGAFPDLATLRGLRTPWNRR